MGKTVTMLLVLFFLTASSIVTPLPVKAEPKTIVVPDDFPTIQKAVNHASAGDTVFVRAGTYFINDSNLINLEKPVSVIGENPYDTIIVQQPTSYYHETIKADAANITISGFTFKNFNVAIDVGYSYASGAVPNCYITGNRFIDGQEAINVEDAVNYTITNNYFSNNAHWAISAATILMPSGGTIVDNTIVGNGQASVGYGGGIDFWGASYTVVANNTFSNGIYGLFMSFSHNIDIIGNNITDNQETGIVFGAFCNNMTVYGNDIARNKIGLAQELFRIDGMGFVVQPGNIVYGNNFVDNGQQVLSYVPTGDNITDIIAWDNGKIGNYWSDYQTKYPNATEIDNSGIGDAPYVINWQNVDRYPLMESYTTIPPEISLLSPLSQKYNESSVSLVFLLDKSVNWAGYSLDGEQNVTITGNTTLTGLSSGVHNVTVYANDTYGNMGASETGTFTVAVPEPFPTVPVAAASVTVVAVVIAGLLVYFKKRKR